MVKIEVFAASLSPRQAFTKPLPDRERDWALKTEEEKSEETASWQWTTLIFQKPNITDIHLDKDWTTPRMLSHKL